MCTEKIIFLKRDIKKVIVVYYKYILFNIMYGVYDLPIYVNLTIPTFLINNNNSSVKFLAAYNIKNLDKELL